MHNQDLRKKNQFIIISFLIFYLVYLVSIVMTNIQCNYYFAISSSLFFIFIYLLTKVNIQPRIIQICIIVCLNVLILLLIYQSIYILNIFWLIFYLILLGSYQSIKLVTITSIVVTFEIVILAFTHFHFSLHYPTENYILISFTLGNETDFKLQF